MLFLGRDAEMPPEKRTEGGGTLKSAVEACVRDCMFAGAKKNSRTSESLRGEKLVWRHPERGTEDSKEVVARHARGAGGVSNAN